MWHATRQALDPAAPSFLAGTEIAEGSAREAAALLVLELAYADPVLTPEDRELVAAHLRQRWGIALTAPAAARASKRSGAPASRTTPTGCANVSASAQRLELVERMWTVAFSDGAIGAQEDRLMHRRRRAARHRLRRRWPRCGSGCSTRQRAR